MSSGAGLGLLVWLALLRLTASGGGIAAESILPTLGLGIGLTNAGLISSTLHLANPKNAWRAFSRVRTSWLSREGVLVIALYPVAALDAWLAVTGAPQPLSTAVGVLLGLLALGVLYCTGMIYACLKTVPRWHNWLVPACYVLLGLYSGALLSLPFVANDVGAIPQQATLVLVLLAMALLVKAIYYIRFRAPVGKHTINQALTLGPKTIRLLDVGHTHGTFLTDEFCFQLARARSAVAARGDQRRISASVCGAGCRPARHCSVGVRRHCLYAGFARRKLVVFCRSATCCAPVSRCGPCLTGIKTGRKMAGRPWQMISECANCATPFPNETFMLQLVNLAR